MDKLTGVLIIIAIFAIFISIRVSLLAVDVSYNQENYNRLQKYTNSLRNRIIDLESDVLLYTQDGEVRVKDVVWEHVKADGLIIKNDTGIKLIDGDE